MCGNAFRAFEYWMDIVRPTKGAQSKYSEMEKGGEKKLSD
jgi:hypothetical protein